MGNTYKNQEELERLTRAANDFNVVPVQQPATQQEQQPAVLMQTKDSSTKAVQQPVIQAQALPSFNMAGWQAIKPTYASDYAARIDALLDEVLNREAFSYDAESDAMYQQYQKQYQREGTRAMNDAMADLAASAGGMNSYAVTAAQQANNYYNAQLADRIPELARLAYEMYLQDYNQDVSNLGLLRQQEQDAYGRYQDDLADWYAQMEAAYNQHRDSVADSQWQQNFDYNARQDAIAQQNWLEQMAYQKQQDALAQQNWQTQFDYQAALDKIAQDQWQQQFNYGKEQDAIDNKYRQDVFDYEREQTGINNAQNSSNTAYERAMDMILMGVKPEAATLESAGISDAMANALLAQVISARVPDKTENNGTNSDALALLLAQMSKGSSGGSSGGGGSGGGSKAPTKEEIKEMQNFYEVEPDGIWGKESSTAAGGQTAEQAWQEYEDHYRPPVRYDQEEETPATSNKYTGTNYMQDAIDAALRGDRETAEAALAARAEKMSSPDYKGTGGGTSMEEAWAQIEQLLAESEEEDEASVEVKPPRNTDGRTYDNGTLTRDQIAEMQNYYEVDADGLWGKNSSAAAGGQTAEQAWEEYSQLMGYTDEPEDLTLANRHGDDWVLVNGYSGRMTWVELENKVDNGEVEEEIDRKTGTVIYRKAN